jgi:hypothetical protein
VAAGLWVAACGNPSAAPPTSTTTSSTSTTTTVAPSTTSSTSSTTSTTTSTAAATGACRATQLTMATTGSSGAAGTIELTFSLTNTSGTTCPMRGYPGLQLLGSSGQDLPTTVLRGGGLSFENVPVTSVSLAPHQVAYFNLGYSDVVAIPPACSTASALAITPPTAVTHGTVHGLSIQACSNGTVHVSPVFAPTDAAGTATTAPTA